jgi:hypothetical protein
VDLVDPKSVNSFVSTIKTLVFLTPVSSLCSKSRLTCLGGILADVMGMGKTMTMLSAIAFSKLTTSTELADNGDGVAEGSRLIRQTLIVLPSSRKYFFLEPPDGTHLLRSANTSTPEVLDVWDTEIKRQDSDYFEPPSSCDDADLQPLP